MRRPTETTRQNAMKRYIKNSLNDSNDYTKYPYRGLRIRYLGSECDYNAFLDGISFTLTTEDVPDEITDFKEEFHNSWGMDYPNIQSIIDLSEKDYKVQEEKIDINAILNQAKEKGYRFSKKQLRGTATYFWKYRDAYYKIALLDKNYGIVNDGEDAIVRFTHWKSPLFIVTNCGVAAILPVASHLKNAIIIE